MVDVISAYQMVNASVLRVATDCVVLDVLETESNTVPVRLDEAVNTIAETRDRLDKTVVVAHELSQYVNRFYSITLSTNDTVWIDYLVGHRIEEIDLTEFGEYV